jgi:hypothetical protein
VRWIGSAKGVGRVVEDKEAIESEDKRDVRSSLSALAGGSDASSTALPIIALAVSSSSSLEAAAATPSKTARSLSGRSKMCDAFACRMYLCCKHAGWMNSPIGSASGELMFAILPMYRQYDREKSCTHDALAKSRMISAGFVWFRSKDETRGIK